MSYMTIDIPTEGYDFFWFNLPTAIKDSLRDDLHRMEKLVIEALDRMGKKKEFYLFGIPHNMLFNDDCYQFDVKEEFCIISGVSRGTVFPYAIFPVRSLLIAAEYFVWIVSEGEVKINWQLYV